MAVICTEIAGISNSGVFEKLEKKYGFKFDENIKSFFKENNGGIPEQNTIKVNGKEYEVRCFLSFNSGEYNSIDMPMDSFQKETHGKIIPIAKDSGDNYYCIHTENEKVYYWDKDENLYYNLADSFMAFLEYFNGR